MRLVVADCECTYTGRLNATLPRATRLLMLKADGTVLIHADEGSKALNWMSPPCTVNEADGTWTVLGSKGERLDITVHEVHEDIRLEPFGAEPGLAKTHSEAEIQELLAACCDEIEDGLTLVRREYPTDIGPVDLLCRDADGAAVAVEIKRVGDISGVEQLARYLELLDRDPTLNPVRGVLAAQSVKPQARTLAEHRGLRWVEVDVDVLAGRRQPELTLF